MMLKIPAKGSDINPSTKGETSRDDCDPGLNISRNEYLHKGGVAMGRALTQSYKPINQSNKPK